jgi:hypothetical protein
VFGVLSSAAPRPAWERRQTGAATMMSILEKLPGMEDAALSTLHANAVRLEQAGSPTQRASAGALLPAIEAELTARRTAKQERLAQARRERSKQKAAEKAA